MSSLSRRQLLKTGALGAAALAAAPFEKAFAGVLPLRRADSLVFRPYLHPLVEKVGFVYAATTDADPFKSAVTVSPEGIVVPESVASQPFSINTQWFVEGFGNIFLEADNGGQFYTREDFERAAPLNLNYEFARSRVARNDSVRDRYQQARTVFSTEVNGLLDLSQQLFEDASKASGEQQAGYADQALLYALWAGEKMELEHARAEIERQRRRDKVYFGCETRQYIWAKHEDMTEAFVELFNYATVTHYVWDTWYEIFEPSEGQYRWGIKDNIVDWLLANDITIEGRPLFWFHPWVTPDWLKEKNFEELKRYAVNHVRNVVGHYGDKIHAWEVVNEYHDWANIHRHTPEQMTEFTRLACETVHEVNPKIVRLINNCCTWAEYAARGRDSGVTMESQGPAITRPLRSPRQFMKDLLDAGVPFEEIGIQVYYPDRDLSDIARQLERFSVFGKPLVITEMATSSGPQREDILLERMEIGEAPYDWHRPWDEDLQADWLEAVYTIFYSKSNIEGIHWYDFADFRTFIRNGGLIREGGARKPSFYRLKNLLASWDRLPEPKAVGAK